MNRTETFTDRIVKLERLPSSRYGNPRWLVSFAEHGAYKTNVDGSVNYGIENSELRGPVEATVERIRGTEQVAYLKPAKAEPLAVDDHDELEWMDDPYVMPLPDSPDTLARQTGL